MELTERRDQLATMDAQALRELAASLLDRVSVLDTDNRTKQLKIDQLTHEMAVLKRWRFGKRSEQLDSEQRLLFEEALDADLEAISQELIGLRSVTVTNDPKAASKRAPLPARCHVPRSATSRPAPFAPAVAR